MTFLDALTSLFVSDAYAEESAAAPEEPKAESQATESKGAEGESGEGEKSEEAEGEEKEEGGDGGGDDEEGAGDEEEEEEEEEEEPEDLMPKLQEECAKTAACNHHKQELEECVERVKLWDEDERPAKQKPMKEDCVEEFFEFTHCVTQCAAPKLFKALA